jgi:deoxycytidylate deaminase
MSKENKNSEYYFREALKLANKSMCKRGRGGSVVVFKDEIIGRGYNAPPNDEEDNRMCQTNYRTSSKPKSDRTCCVHAEWRAIINAIKNKGDIYGSSIYYVSIDENGDMLKAGKPYCTVCSRLALDVGIKYFGLWQEEGIKMFVTKEYNRLSYDFHKEN